MEHFGADTIRISQNFRFRSQIALVSAPTRFRNRSKCIYTIGICIDRFPKLSHNQHPAGSHSKSRAGLFASSKNKRGANNIFFCEPSWAGELPKTKKNSKKRMGLCEGAKPRVKDAVVTNRSETVSQGCGSDKPVKNRESRAR